MLNTFLFVCLCYAFVVAAVYLMQRSILYPGATGGPAGAAVWGEAVLIDTSDGERLFALHAPAAPAAPTVLFLHGNADRADRYGFFAQALADRGIGLLALSYRGFPGSSGRPSEGGLITDGLAAYDWLSARSDGAVVVLGQSLGSGIAVAIAAERPVSALILLSAYDSIVAVARSAYFFLPVTLLIKDTFRSDLRIGDVSAPKLHIHGGRDTIIPLARGRALFDAAPEPKQMVVLDEFGHNDLWTPQLVQRLAGFVAEAAER